jgi:Spy/CpxP family protein refolding chaperone
MTRFLLALAAALAASAALAQHVQPYAGLQDRAIKALSDQQIADLKNGRGMGLALAAELNGYPGPLHVIELRRELALTDAQLVRVEALFQRMKDETIPLGEALIARESALDRQFSERRITLASLDETTARIGEAQAKLRAAHLRYHLAMLEVLTPEQVKRYGELRGYAAGHGPTRQHHRH